MNIKKFRIEHTPTMGSIEVEIDFDHIAKIKNNTQTESFTVERIIKESVEFWSDWEYKLAENGGNYQETFLKNLAEYILKMVTYQGYNVIGVIDEFENLEGWFPIDGSFGIKLISIDESTFDNHDEFEISTITTIKQ